MLPKTAIHLFFATSVMKSYDLLIVGSESGVIIFAFQGKQLLVTEPSDGYLGDITYYFSEAK